jgi:AhpD family alkylhydroperoxidase
MQIHSDANVPDDARKMLEQVEAQYGFVPNLLGIMGGAPSLLQAYLALGELFDQTSLSPLERQIVLLAASRENECDYCMAAHSVIADMQQLPADVIEAIRDDREIADGNLESLRRLTAETVRTRGWPSDSTRAQFFDAGYTEASALAVILGIGMKTLSNYTNHLAETPLDAQFEGRKWTPANR